MLEAIVNQVMFIFFSFLLLYILIGLNIFCKFQRYICYLSRNVFPILLFQRFRISVNLILVRMAEYATQIQKQGNTNVHVLLNTPTQTARPVSALVSIIIVGFVKVDLLINYKRKKLPRQHSFFTFHIRSFFFPIEIQPCDSNPCLNGGTCSDSTDQNSYICDCAGGFTGINCQAGGLEMEFWSNECKCELMIVFKKSTNAFISTFYRNRALCNRSL